eukprot:TRINITY_DN53115_c0_g1_i1.p1 TRINITY_DN53115_c0_g1~~TRINITY_DN53115_c0_g1_i1.p1  ORF type:complete len:439 (+),score=63.88 TRINITY_DN53115_c0_g1_i1:32-1318(+)
MAATNVTAETTIESSPSEENAGNEEKSSGSTKKPKAKQLGQNAVFTRQGNSELHSLTGREPEFAELGDFNELYKGLGTHARQHVNPLQTHLQVPTPAPDWGKLFADPSLPLQVDVGCGSGRFVLIRARRMVSDGSADTEETVPVLPEETGGLLGDRPEGDLEGPGIDPCVAVREFDMQTGRGVGPTTSSDTKASPSSARANVLGLEIREKLVDRAQAWTERLGLTNCRFLFTNVTVSWKSLLHTYPGPIELVSMQFPDPYFKKKHFKRRHVQPRLVKEIAETLMPNGRIFLQGDVPEAVRWMRDMFERHGDGRFSLAAECRGAPNLMRAEWETPLTVEDGSLSEREEEEEVQPTETEAKMAEPRKRKRGQQAPCLQETRCPLAWSGDPSAGWLPENPLRVSTEREVYVAQAKAPVYRVMLVRKESEGS